MVYTDAIRKYVDGLQTAAEALGERIAKPQIDRLMEFLRAYEGADYPGDLIRPIVALDMILSYNPFPGTETKNILYLALCKGDFGTGGSLRWKVSRGGTLSCCFTYKKIDQSFRFIFGDLSYPLNVTVERYCNMDNAANHSCDCPMYLPEEHEDWQDTCECEAVVEATFMGRFVNHKHLHDKELGLGAFLLHAHYQDDVWQHGYKSDDEWEDK